MSDAPAAPDPARPDPGWRDALRALAILAVDPGGIGGVRLRARAGPVRDRWLEQLRARLGAETPLRKLPLHVDDGRLLGGLDLVATLAAGRPVASRGLLADAHAGVLQVSMADRLDVAIAARIAQVMDAGELAGARGGAAAPARFGVVALDEGADAEEGAPPALCERLAVHLDLTEVAPRAATGEAPGARTIAAARDRLPDVATPEPVIEALCAAAGELGIGSLRAPLLALRVARAAAALAGRDTVGAEDASLAARLVLTPRATQAPAPSQPEAAPEESTATDGDPAPDVPETPADASAEPDAPAPSPESPDDEEREETAPADGPLDETVVAAALSAMSPGQLETLRARARGRGGGSTGRAGALVRAKRRGRRVGVRQGVPRSGETLDVVETLRAAAPWQRLRGRAVGPDGAAVGRLRVRPDDFRVARIKHRSETATIFAVDASGSSALHRLNEAKGAVEMLLADCYVRRDRVALVAFRGASAEVQLPPTRSLTRAKRSLAMMPGGGGTPLAAGLVEAIKLAIEAIRRGDTPILVVLTDGRANVALDGTGERERARDDGRAAAREIRAAGVAALLVDTSPRPRASARELAEAMGARYLPLPQADAGALSREVKQTGARVSGQGTVS